MFSRRDMLGAAAALPFLPAAARAGGGATRVGGARIVVLDNRLWTQVRFGDRGPYSFILDSGAWTNAIQKGLARTLKLRERGSLIGKGIGGTQQFVHYEAPDVSIGNISIGTADFSGFEGAMLHPEASGLLSAAFLTVADADLDFDRNEWRIYPDGRTPAEGYVALAGTIRGSAQRRGATKIYVDARMDGQTLRLLVDTGAPGQLLLAPAATRRLGLWNERSPYVPTPLAGIGGSAGLARLVRGSRLQLGPIAFDRPLVMLSDPKGQDMESDGILGLGLIERMNLSTDVRGGKLWAMRNGRPARPERYGLTGLWLEERKDGLEVVAASPQSPAVEAGLRLGDAIIGVSLDEWIRKVARRPGTVVDFAFRRDGIEQAGRLTLRAFL
ncbi:hypothetical protein E2493_18300 [Sphingomonas parva]|uniref:Peptidase A2 domain-containing protein n=1 Tax=Sphingomonas parva TaxID=2555898 RepID=A0A4Y8ZNR0_9SPHN|nr:aspartyl protease family protein [Sphingomonas parva]TFI56785.1 hypothetical protein E2493_18300 [Sphingomonas parva]